MTLNLIQILSIIAIFQSLFLAGIYFDRKDKFQSSNSYFAMILVVLSILIAFTFTQSFGMASTFVGYHSILFLFYHVSALLGPLLYFYTRSILEKDFCFTQTNWFHFTPFIIVIIFFLIQILSLDSFKIWSSPLWMISSLIILFSQSIYFVLCIRKLHVHGLKISNFFLLVKDSKLKWLRFYIGFLMVIWLLNMQFFIITRILGIHRLCPYITSLNFCALFLFTNTLVYLGIKKPSMYKRIFRYQQSSLSEDCMTECIHKIKYYFENEKSYLNHELTLKVASNELNISIHQLSQIINETYHVNFNQLINQYRIEESIRLLNNGAINQNILEIAYQVGFNSKSSFNRSFKKYTQKTPREFKQSIQKTA